MSCPHVSVVVPCAGQLVELPDLVDSLLEQQCEFVWEVVFVDNGLDSEARRLLEVQAERLPLKRIVHEQVRGIGPARNAGAQAAAGEVLAFVDADDTVAVSWLSALVAATAERVIAGGHLELDELNPTWLAESRGRHSTGTVYRCEGVFPVAPGGNMAIVKVDFLSLGGFQPDSRSLEDFEFCLRAWEAGFAVQSAGVMATVHYRLRGTARSLLRQGYRYGYARTAIYSELWHRRLVRRWTFRGWKSWAMLMFHVPLGIFDKGHRGKAAWIVGNRFGRVVGSIRKGVIYV